jgi:drug/metabolite transporter (DMT)-like permease
MFPQVIAALTPLVKFLHLLFVLSLAGIIVYCLSVVSTKKFVLNPAYQKIKIHHLNRYLLLLAAGALCTGTLLVYPKHFTYHTSWIQTAYALLALFAGILLILLSIKQRFARSIWLMIYLLLALILITAIHDAVTKIPLINLALVHNPAK